MFPPHATRVVLSAPSVPDASSHAILWSVAKCDSLLRPTVPAVVDVADAELPDAVIAVGTSQRTTRLAVSSEFQQFCPPTVRVMHFTFTCFMCTAVLLASREKLSHSVGGDACAGGGGG